MTEEDLLQYKFTKRIVRSVVLLTRRKEDTYKEYLKKIKQDSNAYYVMIQDIKHNLDISRIKNPSETDMRLMKRYEEALDYLLTFNHTH